MLARKRAAELEHEVRDVVGNRFEAPHALRGLEVHDRPHVQAADRGVSVDAGDGPVAANDLQEAVDVVAQLLGRDSGVLHERQRLVVALHRHRQPERRFTQAPNASLLGQRQSTAPATAEARTGEIFF